jgi:hypothetical protein
LDGAPEKILQAAERLDNVGLSASQLHAHTLDGLDRLSGRWAGQAHDNHRVWAQATYREHFDSGIQTLARTQSDKDKENGSFLQELRHHVWEFLRKLGVTIAVIGVAFCAAVAVFNLLVAQGLFRRAVVSLIVASVILTFFEHKLESMWRH